MLARDHCGEEGGKAWGLPDSPQAGRRDEA